MKVWPATVTDVASEGSGSARATSGLASDTAAQTSGRRKDRLTMLPQRKDALPGRVFRAHVYLYLDFTEPKDQNSTFVRDK